MIFTKYVLGVLCIILLLSNCNFDPTKQGKDVAGDSAYSSYYNEPHRPQFHFSPEANWMNDPNGMVFYAGEYHLFYQYYPDSTVWGPMHWGHAVSKDLVRWEHLPIALYPDTLGYIFSGSAVVDHKNTSGFGKNEKPPLVAIFTHHNLEGEKSGSNTFQYQSIAYSNDQGRSWTKYKGNPVIENPGIKDFRDPKVIWHEDSKKWIMVIAAYDKVHIYNSPDLINWTYQSEFGIPGDNRLWECPDLFPMEVEGSDEKKWVLIISIQKEAPNGGTGTSYFVGDFDGKNFIADNKRQYWADYGKDNYAMVTWSDVSDGRRLAMGWMNNWQYAQVVPTQKWRSAMTLPRKLTLHKSNEDYQLRSWPVEELKVLEKNPRPKMLIKNMRTSIGHSTALYKFEYTFNRPASSRFVLRFSNSKKEHIDVGYDGISAEYFIDRSNSGKVNFQEDFAGNHRGEANYSNEEINMTIYIDHASVELFADQGRCVMTDIFFASEPFTQIELIVEKGKVKMKKGTVTELNSIW